jgi:hypothetical protein
MNPFDLVQKLNDEVDTVVGDAATFIVNLVTDADAAKIASTQYDEEPHKYVGENAAKLLADDTFGGMKHFLRAKIDFAVDVAWQISQVRKPLREKANAAAKAELSHNTP